MNSTDLPIREPEQIRQDAARKLRDVQISEQFQLIHGCLVEGNWTTPRLADMVINQDGQYLGRCDGDSTHRIFLVSSKDLIQNIHGVAPVAELDGDEVGYLVTKVAEIKGQR